MKPEEKSSPQGMGRSMLSSTAGILLSRVFGLARDVCSAAYWGASDVAQAAYTVAFAIPNSLRQLFGEGAFTSAFVPMISGHLATDEREKAWKLASRAITLQFVVLAAVALVFALVGGTLGFLHVFQDPTTDTAMRILPVLMPFAVLICMAGALSSILNSLKAFFLPSIMQFIFNAVQVAVIGLLAWCWKNDDPVALWIFCGSTLLAGILQVAALLFACRKHGYVYHFDLSVKDPEVGQLCRRILPGLVGAGVMQINSLIDKVLGLILGSAAIGALTFSQRLVYLPVGIFGVAMGMVALPALSRAQAREDRQGVADGLNYALRTVLFLALPCTAFLLVGGQYVITFLFARGAFNDSAIVETSFTLAFYVMGLPAFCCAKVATNPFHARKDTRTPMLIAVGCMFLNLILNLILMRFLKQGGLALSTSICSWLNVVVLLGLNRKFLPEWNPWKILKDALTLLVAAAISAAGGWCVLKGLFWAMAHFEILGRLLPTQTLLFGFYVVCMLAGTGVAYLLACLLLRRPEPRELLRSVLRR